MGWGNAIFMMMKKLTKHVIIWEFPNKFYKTISKNNMTRMIKMIWHKASQNACLKLHTIFCEQ